MKGEKDLETSREHGLNRSIGKFYLVFLPSYKPFNIRRKATFEE